MDLINTIHVLLSVIITVQADFEIRLVPTSTFIVETQSTDRIVATIRKVRASRTFTSSLNCRIGITILTTSGGQTSTSTSNVSPFVVSSRNFVFVENTIKFSADSQFKLDATRVSKYELYPDCIDPVDNVNTQTNTASVIVYVFPNAKPSFRRPFDTATVNVALNSSAVVGARVDNVTAYVINDQPTDDLAFSIRNIKPNVDYFTINTASGILTNKVDLRSATQSPIELTIDVTDGFNSADRSLVLTVTLLNMNQRPDIVGLPDTINIDENTQTLSIVDLTVKDEGVLTNLKPVCTVQPTGGNEVFDLVTRPISLKSRANQFGSMFLDFETTPRYTISCTVSDGFLQSQNEVLILNVNDVNEAPVFSENLVNCIMDESKARVSACNLGFRIRDPEGNRFITRLSQDLNSIRFALASNSNNNNQNSNFFTEDYRLTFSVDYDVDQSRMPERETLLVNAIDINGAASTATVLVFIRDVNDNTPDIINTAFDVTYQARTGLLGSIQATDDDSGRNGKIDYRLVKVVPPNAINFVSVLRNGDIQYKRQYPESLAGSSVYLSVEAKDRGTPARSSTGTVVLTLEVTTTTSTTTTTTTTIPTTIPTTTPEPGFFEKVENVASFSVLMTLLLPVVLIGLYNLCRWCIIGQSGGGGGQGGGGGGQGGICDNCCRPPPSKRVQPSPLEYEDFDMQSVTASDYEDGIWHTGDNYVTGRPSRHPVSGYNNVNVFFHLDQSYHPSLLPVPL